MWAPDGLRACDFFMDEASVMATENSLMAAALTPGTTTIRNAASEPHVQDLARLLVAMGARIDGIGSNVLDRARQGRLGGAATRSAPDHIEVGSFMALAAVTGGEMRITGTVPDDLKMIRMVFERLGLQLRPGRGDDLVVPARAAPAREGRRRRRDPEDRRRPVAGVPRRPDQHRARVATQAEGTVLIFEKMFENRLFFVDKLTSMGARIVLCDPHRAIVSGPSRLHGERMESPDIRAGMAMLIASLCAEGVSEIGNVGQIDRGYERIDERLRDLGARIERVSGDRVAT